MNNEQEMKQTIKKETQSSLFQFITERMKRSQQQSPVSLGKVHFIKALS